MKTAASETAILSVSTEHVKSVQIQCYFWPVFSCIRSEYGDLRSFYRWCHTKYALTETLKLPYCRYFILVGDVSDNFVE